MASAAKDARPRWAKEPTGPPSTIDSAAWWQPLPGWLDGFASIGGIFGLIPYDSARFNPGVDAALLHRDAATLMFQFKQAASS